MTGLYLMAVVAVVCFSTSLVAMIRAELVRLGRPSTAQPRKSHTAGSRRPVSGLRGPSGQK